MAGTVAPPAPGPRQAARAARNTPPPARRRRAVPTGGRTPRTALLAIIAAFVVACLLQRPGKIASDTKLDVVLAPGRFLASALHLWNSGADFGFVQNQSAGYLFPMGPFFLAGKAAGVPPWITQRLWWALLLTVALWGVVRLADALGVGRPWSRLVAALAYTLSPMVLGQLGATSIALTGAALLPWMLLPLVRVDRLGARRAAALSGLAVFATGGVNASVTLCVLVAPVLWLLLCAGPDRRRAWTLRGWWALSVGLACAWWVIALAFQGKYGLDFLVYTETPQATTAFAPLTHVLDGADNWLYWLHTAQTWLPSGWAYVSAVPVILGISALAAAGLYGVARADLPRRRFLIATLVVGALLVGTGWVGPLGPPAAGPVRSLLTAPLGAFRNVWKFQPLVMLPLALGLAHGLTAGVSRRRSVPGVRLVAGLLVVAGLAGSALPLARGETVRDGSFTAVPSYWTQAADWLGTHTGDSRTLLVPGEGFAEFDWGRPLDEPLQWISRSPWASRHLIPLGGVGSTRLLDGIESELALGDTTGLAKVLRRSGTGYLLLRNDTGVRQWDTPPSTTELHAALRSSGLTRVASFGPTKSPTPTAGELLTGTTRGSGPGFPALEVYAVPGSAPRVDSYPTATTQVVSGGPEAMTQLGALGLLDDTRATVLAADLPRDATGAAPPTGPDTTWIDTDTLTRRDTAFGVLRQGQSYLLAAGERAAGATADPQQRLDPVDVGHQTVAVTDGAAGVTASSYGFALVDSGGIGPYAAVDGNRGTFWQARVHPGSGSTGAWLQVDLGRLVPVSSLNVRLLEDGTFRPEVRAIRVTTERGSVLDRVRSDESVQKLAAPSGLTRYVRVTFEQVDRQADPTLGAGIRELTIPGVTIQRRAQAPADVASSYRSAADGGLAYAFRRYRTADVSPFTADEEIQLNRRFTLPRDAVLQVIGTALSTRVAIGPLLPGWFGRGTFVSPCGVGPDVVIDGAVHQTKVTGTAAQLAAQAPLPMLLCTAYSAVRLTAGDHEVSTVATHGGAVSIDGLVMKTAAPDVTATPRSVSVRTWGDERRTVDIAAGARSYLAVHENANSSWTASLNGQKLAPVRLDGWQQGFVVPAGAAGTIVLSNAAGGTYRIGLAVGAGLVLVLVLLAALPGRRRSTEAETTLERPVPAAAGVGRDLPVVVAATAALVLLVGPVAAAVPVLWLLARVVRGAAVVLPWVAAAAMGAAGIVNALAPGSGTGSGTGAFSGQGQVAAGVALAAVLVAATLRPPSAESPADALRPDAPSPGA